MRPAFVVVGGGSFCLPHDLFHSTLLYSIQFSSPVKICFKNGTFSSRFSRESHEKYGQEVFFRLTYVEPKVVNITKLVQMIFSACFGHFEYVGYLLCDITLVVLN